MATHAAITFATAEIAKRDRGGVPHGGRSACEEIGAGSEQRPDRVGSARIGS